MSVETCGNASMFGNNGNQFIAVQSTETAPGYAFDGMSDTGIYANSSEIGLSFSGQSVFNATNTETSLRNVTSNGGFDLVDNSGTTQIQFTSLGTNTEPVICYQGDNNTGILFPANGEIGFAGNNARRLTVAASVLTASVVVSLPTGTDPRLYFGTESTTGLCRLSANRPAMKCSGTQVMDWQSTGVGVSVDLSGTKSFMSAQPSALFSSSTTTAALTASTDYTLAGTGATGTNLVFWTPTINSDFTWAPTTGLLTVTNAGTYLASFKLQWSGIQTTAGNSVEVYLVQNGTVRPIDVVYPTGSATPIMSDSAVFSCAANDTLALHVFTTSTGAAIKLDASVGNHFFNVIRLF